MAKKTLENKQKQIGRPRKTVQRDRYLPVRVHDEEIETVRQAAENAGISLSRYVRIKLGLPSTGYGD